MANYIVQPHSWIEVEGDSMPYGYTDSQAGDEGVIMQPVLTIIPDNSVDNIGSGSYWEYCLSAVNFNISGGTPMINSTDPVTGITTHSFYSGFNGVTLPDEVTVGVLTFVSAFVNFPLNPFWAPLIIAPLALPFNKLLL